MPIRERIITSGPYREAEIYFISKKEKSKSRATKKKESRKEQKRLNKKNSTKHVTRLIHGNFLEGYKLDLTYDDENLPKNYIEAEKDVTNYITRTNRRRKKKGIGNLKYIAVIEYKEPKNGRAIRIHHHLIIDNLEDRDTVEKEWKKGRANCCRLQEDEAGLKAISKYITKVPKDNKGKKAWKQSQGLIQPKHDINDSRFSRKKMWEIYKCQGEKEYLEKIYPGHRIIDFTIEENEFIGIKITINMRKKEKG